MTAEQQRRAEWRQAVLVSLFPVLVFVVHVMPRAAALRVRRPAVLNRRRIA